VALPREALQTLDLIAVGGPFPYPQDGITYRNLERILPNRPGGYYREYTVETPGSPDRGARRIVRGAAGEFYWTADHYASFRRIVP
jgi:ribonuclease T1